MVMTDPVASASIKTMWDADAASHALGMEILSAGPGVATLAMEVRADMVNGWDLCHGGLVATLADSAFAVACNSRGRVTVGAGFDVTFLESGRATGQENPGVTELARAEGAPVPS